MRKSIKTGQQIILIKYRGREKKKVPTIDFTSLDYFNNFPNDYYILGGELYKNTENYFI